MCLGPAVLRRLGHPYSAGWKRLELPELPDVSDVPDQTKPASRSRLLLSGWFRQMRWSWVFHRDVVSEEYHKMAGQGMPLRA
jgi:hypothetical protein